jgi:hypothetical protein
MGIALSQQLRLAMSYKKQVDLVTPLTAADMWSLRGTAIDLHAQPVNEDDATDLGKGVYPTTTFPSFIDAGGSWNGRLTSEAACMLTCFGIGATTKTSVATGGFKYTCVAPDLTTSGLDMPVATGVETIGTVTDKLLVGLACEEFGFQFKTGPGRDSATFTSAWLGTGQYVKPSGITLPTIYAEHSMNAGTITTLTLIGFNYLTNKNFVSAEWGWKNNIRDQSSYYPGSGALSGFQLRGRMRRGVPTITLKCVVECASGSSEEDALLAQTEGTGVITTTGATFAGGGGTHQFKVTFQRLRVKASPIGDSDGIASYSLEYSILQHPTNGVLTTEMICEQDTILG